MKLRFIAASVAVVSLSWGAAAQTVIKPQGKIAKTSFAVITDTPTWEACADEITRYSNQLASEGLPTFIVHSRWQSPEEVKSIINTLYKKNHLEGVVLVGDVPVAMIQKAQHLTSAFKMDEKKYPRFDSSVPSDRFYDDLDLRFDYVGRDSVHPGFFHYDIAATSPQQIRCDIYSARVKPIDNGVAPHEQIKRFFNKAVAEHQAVNPLDRFFSYTGEGSYSNSLTAWAPEAVTIREQMPGTFDSPTAPGRARFMRYNFSDYPKNDVANMLRRTDLDLTIFHEHGMPERQYISAIPFTEYADQHVDQIKEGLRSLARRKASDPKAMEQFVKTYTEMGLDSTWWADYNDPAMIEADSIADARRGILLQDVTDIAPNSRMVIFDACYNGDFRERDNIASRYIFSDGRCVATFANSVNVLQDKMANELLGLLWLGARVGQWAQETNILESHVIGDPTMRFASAVNGVDAAELCRRPYKVKEELKNLKSPHMDLRNLAMHRLWRNGYKGLAPILVERFNNSPLAMERFTAFALLEKLGGVEFGDILVKASTDPYEFIRRKAVTYMGRVGRDEYVAALVDAYNNDPTAARVVFNVETAIRSFSDSAVTKSLEGMTGARAEALRRQYSSRAEVDSTIMGLTESKWRKLYISGLRNNPIVSALPAYLTLLDSASESDDVKIALLDALAWYDKAYNREEIAQACLRLMKSPDASAALKEQARRTYYRVIAC